MHFFYFLDPKSLVTLSRANKKMYDLSRFDGVWKSLYERSYESLITLKRPEDLRISSYPAYFDKDETDTPCEPQMEWVESGLSAPDIFTGEWFSNFKERTHLDYKWKKVSPIVTTLTSDDRPVTAMYLDKSNTLYTASEGGNA